MGSQTVESPRQLVGAAIQEFFGALLMFLVLWPFVGVLGDTWTAWVAHFFFVMLCDIVSGGSQVNPSVSVAMFVHGAISFPGAIVRILAQLAAGVVAYPLLQKLSPSYVGVGGPCLQDGVSTTTGALAEFTLTFALLTLIYLAITIIGAPGQRPIIAAGIRCLIVAGTPYTGPAMNPMIAFGWAVQSDAYKTFDHYLVYWIAPTVGAVLATVLFAVFQASFLDERKKNKAD
ncbi:aquaporin sip1-2 [Nannochloropsis gaditana CCMP526]|uniref:aquaporin sip1-2 n=1 Tax=Nannochloropsis gaditana (strain CCMP526) TaxID=1093141 RepID=UPI00029F5846|nr:aquaporin sip1-2 [Nannochloropsis gaditana CCMP526]EKU22600.1 aquaporin sip1-2 [Nannochloropsis gaditana CCMP526]|eukprot:XP_005853759.1 aquaporin sip1-2 [Nannochloropsis gaditana CCMP526]